MAKRKKTAAESQPETLSAATDAANHMNQLIDSMDTYTKHRIECFVCGETDTTRDETEASYARELYALGWRYLLSECFATIGPMCPMCAMMPDAERGEL